MRQAPTQISHMINSQIFQILGSGNFDSHVKALTGVTIPIERFQEAGAFLQINAKSFAGRLLARSCCLSTSGLWPGWAILVACAGVHCELDVDAIRLINAVANQPSLRPGIFLAVKITANLAHVYELLEPYA